MRKQENFLESTYRDQHRVPFSQYGRKIYVKKADLVSFMESNKIC